MLRSVVAVVIGLIIGVGAVFAAETVGHAAFRTPDIGAVRCSDPATWADQTAAAVCMAATPIQAKIAVVVGWFMGAFAGALAALLIGRKWAPLGWIVAASIFLLSVTNFFALPHPIWMIAGAVFAALLGGFLAVALSGAKYQPPPPDAPKISV